MFYNSQTQSRKVKYKRLLNAAACFGKITSPKSTIPQISFRASESIFCRTFNASDVSSLDISIDAYKKTDGIGIKTFQGSASQKVAEFNDSKIYPIPSKPYEIAQTVAFYRNKRLNQTASNLSLEKMLYHYVYRKKDQKIQIFEEEMIPIDIDKVKLMDSKFPHIIKFSDGIKEYSFNKTKSVLSLKFSRKHPLDSFYFKINKDDLNYYINEAFPDNEEILGESSVNLKLFGERKKNVASKSGLNQWRAAGRKRHHDEVYIPIPIKIHRENPGFFPARDEPFRMTTDEGNEFLAKVCQENNKALMSNPNKNLGNWILRDVLKVPLGQLVTMNHLEKANINSVKIEKLKENKLYKITPIINDQDRLH